MTEEKISVEEAKKQIILMANRTAMLYHYIGEVLQENFGEDKAGEILKEAVMRYGKEIGEQVREKVQEKNLPLTLENYSKGEDLPDLVWDSTKVKEGEKELIRVDYCPLASAWLKKGNQKLARLYCFVDQAKFASYNGIACKHLKNMLDGDEICLFDFEEKENRGGESDNE